MLRKEQTEGFISLSVYTDIPHVIGKQHCRGEHSSPAVRLADITTLTTLRTVSSMRGGFTKLSPLPEEMPDRAEESIRANTVRPYKFLFNKNNY